MTMTDFDPLVRRTFPPPAGPPQPPFVPAARSATTEPTRATARTTRPRRRHPATGGRIIAAGLGATTMFGLIAAMGVAKASSTTNTPTTEGSITLAPLPTITPTIAPVVGTPDPSVAAAPAADAPTATVPTPIVLRARPDVQVVTPTPAQSAPAPIATTSGSA